MFEFLMATGKFGAIGMCLVFVVVFYLAKPGEEISFWGVKFHKKHTTKKKKTKKLPKELPDDWNNVLRAFLTLDDNHVRLSQLFAQLNRINGASDIEARKICSEMQQYGLVKFQINYISLTEKALPLATSLDK